jgi:para-nitrobenzyl esterase
MPSFDVGAPGMVYLSQHEGETAMRATIMKFFAVALATFALAASADAQPRADRVRTDAGQVEGLGAQASGVRAFYGIQFAQAPLGALRWREPQRLRRWRGVREAKAFAPRCMQERIWDDMVFRSPSVSEDCLYLNVWTPARGTRERLPVLFYVHGGGFRAGDSSEPRYDGEALAARGMIVVSANHRLGVFGFLAHPELTAESSHDASGNYGLMDQVAALEWVRRNIQRFGGDPRRIIVAGESAGSMSAHALMASPLSRDFISGAIGESGSLMGLDTSLASGEQNGRIYSNSLGGTSLEQMRAMPAQTLLERAEADGAPRFNVIIDGHVLPKSPREIFEAGEQARVPVLGGSNSQEGDSNSILPGGSASVSNYRSALDRLYGLSSDRVFEYYPAAADGEPVRDAAQDLASDQFMGVTTWAWLEAAARTGASPT